MSSTGTSSCPDCQARTVHWRNTLSGILCAIFCFPCGIYYCLKRRQQHCSRCDCDVIKYNQKSGLSSLGYSFREYQATQQGIPMSMAVAYRNTAYSASINSNTGFNEGSENSRSDLM